MDLSLHNGDGLITASDGIKLSIGMCPPLTFHGFNFFFKADLMSIRSKLDPDGKISPKLFEERYYDTSELSLLCQHDIYKQCKSEIAGELQFEKDSLHESSDTQVELKRWTDGQFDVMSALKFHEYCQRDEIDFYLRSKYQSQGIQSLTGLTHLVVRYHLLRWEKTLYLEQEKKFEIILHLDSLLLQSGKFYDVGTIRFRCKEELDPKSVLNCLYCVPELQNIMIDHATAPTKFNIAASDLKNRSLKMNLSLNMTPIHPALDAYTKTRITQAGTLHSG